MTLDTPAPPTTDAIIEVEDCQKHFPVTRGIVLRKTVGMVKAVDGVSFQIRRGETLSLVGDSGCGKTTTARMILLVESPTTGRIKFKGANLAEFTPADYKEYRSSIQAVFQDPWSS